MLRLVRVENWQWSVTRAGQFVDSWWPLLLLLGILAVCLIKPLGGRAVRAVQAVNRWIHSRLFFPGAALLLQHRRFEARRYQVLRLLWFGSVFAALLAGCFQAPPVWAFALAMTGSWMALSAGGYWVGVESLALEDNEDGGTYEHVELSHQIQANGVLSLLLVLVFIPISFMTADAAFDWYLSPDGSLRTWVFYTLHLLYQAAVDFGDVLDLTVSDVEPRTLGGKALVVTHFIGLTLLVLNGLTLVARREHAIRGWIRRLEHTGDIRGVRQFGARVWDDLLAVASCGRMDKHPDAALRALAQATPPHPRHLKRSPILEGIIRELRRRPTEGADTTVKLRQAAAEALGTWRHPRAADALLGALQDGGERHEVRAQAAAALGRYADVPGIRLDRLRDSLLDVVRDRSARAEIRGKAIDAVAELHHAVVVPDTVKELFQNLCLDPHQPNLVRARALASLRLLGLLDNIVDSLRDLFNRLRSPTIALRREAAGRLVDFGDISEVVNNLILAAGREDDPLTRADMVKALRLIAAAGRHHDLVRPALLRASRDPRFEVRRQGVFGLAALAFEGEVASRLCDMATTELSQIVKQRAKARIAEVDPNQLPPELAARCRALSAEPESDAALNERLVDSVMAALQSHPEGFNALGDPAALAAIMAQTGESVVSTDDSESVVRVFGRDSAPAPNPSAS